jgi:MYXO-CTERM domain-containing protein
MGEGDTMTRPRTVTCRKCESTSGRHPWLLLLLALAAGILWKEYPALVRYLKMARM